MNKLNLTAPSQFARVTGRRRRLRFTENALGTSTRAERRADERLEKHRSLKAKASKKHSKEYAKARARYPSPDLY